MVDNFTLDGFLLTIPRAADIVNVNRFRPVNVIAWIVLKQVLNGVNLQFFLQQSRAPRPDAFEILQ